VKRQDGRFATSAQSVTELAPQLIGNVTAPRLSKAIGVTPAIDQVGLLSPDHVDQCVEFGAALTSVRRAAIGISVEVRAGELLPASPPSMGRVLTSLDAADDRGRPVRIPSIGSSTHNQWHRAAKGPRRTEADQRHRIRE
jgi:acyl-CoA hydrolase